MTASPLEKQLKILLCQALGKPYRSDMTLDDLMHDILTLRSAMQLIVRGRCGVCKRMNTSGCATISDGAGGEGCGEGKLCYHDSVDAEQAAIFALETIGVK